MSTTTSVARPSKKVLHIALWTAQLLLAAAFLGAGLFKATTPFDELAARTSAPNLFSEPLIRFIGISEIAGALGLVLPALTRIRPMLTPLAAACLTTVMVLALGYHVWQSELHGIPVVVVLGTMAAFVAWGRSRLAPIAPRS